MQLGSLYEEVHVYPATSFPHAWVSNNLDPNRPNFLPKSVSQIFTRIFLLALHPDCSPDWTRSALDDAQMTLTGILERWRTWEMVEFSSTSYTLPELKGVSTFVNEVFPQLAGNGFLASISCILGWNTYIPLGRVQWWNDVWALCLLRESHLPIYSVGGTTYLWAAGILYKYPRCSSSSQTCL